MLPAPHSPARRAALLPLLAVVPVALLSAPAGASTPVDAPTGDILTVIDSGDASHQVLLPGTPTVGLSGRVTTVATATGSIVATGIQDQTAVIDVTTTFVQSGEVVSVEADGTFVLDRIVESYDIVDNSVEADGSAYLNKPELQPLVGVGPLSFTYSANAQLLDIATPKDLVLDVAQSASIDELLADGETARFPTEPVGLGAIWTSELVTPTGGSIEARYEVVELDGDEFTVSVSMSADAADILPATLPNGFDTASGTVVGEGQLTGTVGNPFTQLASTDLTMSLTLSGPGITVETVITQSDTQTAS